MTDSAKKAAAMAGVLLEVLKERHLQDAKWGEQNHPLGFDASLFGESEIGYWFRRMMDKPIRNDELAKAAIARCENAHDDGRGTWEHIITEEWTELLACSDPKDARVELIQLAAVCIACVERIDRGGNL